LIVSKGVEWFTGIGRRRTAVPKLYCVSGHVKRPGVFEASMDITLRALIEDHAAGCARVARSRR